MLGFCSGLLGLSGTCVAPGSSTPSSEFTALVNTRFGRTVRQAITESFNLRPVGSETREQLLNRLVAVYLQWTWAPVWGSREDVTVQEVRADPCFRMAVSQVSPLASVKKDLPPEKVPPETGAVPVPSHPNYEPWVIGAVVLGTIGLLYLLTRKKRVRPATVALLPASAVTQMVPATRS